MPRRIPLPLGIETAPGYHPGATMRKCINLHAEKLPEGGKTVVGLLKNEGITTAVTPSPSGAMRGMFTLDNTLFMVVGTKLYEFTPPSTLLDRGTIASTGRVSMASNGAEIVISNGLGNRYVWDGAALASIADGDLPSVGWFESFDQYIVYGRFDGTGWGISALADATSWDALDVASAESDPDIIVMGIRDHRELHLFGRRTVESWYINPGAGSAFPFERAPDGVMEVGCAAKWSVAKIDNTVFWLGIERGGLSVRKMQGRVPVRVSTPAIDDYLDSLATNISYDLSAAYAFTFAYAGHAYYCLTPYSGGSTLVYDISTGLWQTRKTGTDLPWRVSHAAYANDQLYFGDSATGRVGIPSRSVHTEFDDAIAWETVGPPVYMEGRQVTFNAIELVLDGYNKATPRTVSMAFSDNDGETWSAEQSRTTSTYAKARPVLRWTNQGSSRNRIFRFKGSSAARTALLGAYADVELGG